MSLPKRRTLREVTNVGSQVVSMGILEKSQMDAAEKRWQDCGSPGSFGSWLRDNNYITPNELLKVLAAQVKDRNVTPHNEGATMDALRILRETAASFHEVTAKWAAAPHGEFSK